MGTINALRQKTMLEIKNKKIEYKKIINEYLKMHSLDDIVIRVSDNKMGKLKLYEAHGYLLGRIAFFPLKPNGKVDTRTHMFINENEILNDFTPYL